MLIYIYVTLGIQSDCEATHPPTLPYFTSISDNNEFEATTDTEIHEDSNSINTAESDSTLSGNWLTTAVIG